MDSRDVIARRKVADQVRNAVISGSIAPVMAAHAGEPERAAGLTLESATAASAVVLASGLRAPANGLEPTTIIHDEASALTEEDWTRIDALITGEPIASGEPVVMRPDGKAGVSPNRQGWRARLANVERWLADVAESIAISTDEESAPDWSRLRTGVDVALAEVRAMLDERP